MHYKTERSEAPSKGQKGLHWQQRLIAVLLLCTIWALLMPVYVHAETEAIDYAQAENWAYRGTDATKKADIFFVCPTVYSGEQGKYQMPLDDTSAKESFLGATNMEKGIYDPYGSFYAPYYRQVGLNVYEMPLEDRETYLELAYADVKAAFLYYLENDNQGRPILLAGFSQGADLCLRLLKDCFADPAVNDLLVACYAIGWRITQEELAAYPHLRFAEGKQDTGVIIAFNSEAEDVNDSLLVPAGTKSLCINPLNWRTDGVPADKAENLGACFTDYSGAIVTEIPQLTGAYIDETRGTLKVPDVNPEDYPPVLSLFDQGVYHLYDYQFFYRNLQENVGERLAAYLASHGA